MKFFSILLVAVSLLGISCERHEFEGADGTKQLHEHHAAHEPAGHAGAEHSDSKDAHKTEH
jgi:hypothetical protein